jgi:osmotically inducible protein OsmC
MAFGAQLTESGHVPDTLETTAVVTMVPVEGAPTITKIHLTTTAKVPGVTKELFDELAKKAKEGCPISRLFKGTEITLDASLV